MDPVILPSWKDVLDAGGLVIALFVVAAVLIYVIRILLKERGDERAEWAKKLEEWEAKSAQWAESQRQDKQVMLDALQKLGGVIGTLTERLANDQDDRSQSLSRMSGVIDRITQTLDRINNSIDQHRDRTEGETRGKHK